MTWRRMDGSVHWERKMRSMEEAARSNKQLKRKSLAEARLKQKLKIEGLEEARSKLQKSKGDNTEKADSRTKGDSRMQALDLDSMAKALDIRKSDLGKRWF